MGLLPVAKQFASQGATMKPGTVYTFPLKGGLHGACRVLRGPTESEKHSFDGHLLAHATKWTGKPPLDLKHADLRRIARGARGGILHWVKGKPPKKYVEAGVVAVRKAEQSKTANSLAPWSMFQFVLREQLQETSDPVGAANQRKAAKKNTKQIEQQLLAELKARERIDLAGFVPLSKPRSEREPMEVLKGFIAAMHQWEKECNRIEKTSKSNAPVTRFNLEALAQIFDEFCTPKERKHGRAGSYGTPPEYNPRTQKIVAVRECSARRVEIDTQETSGFKRNLTYVLLKKKQGWLIDSRKRNGQNTTL